MKKKSKKGFALIELIVAVGLMILLGVLTVNSLFSISKGAVKAAAVKNARQNGNFALSAIEGIIRKTKEIKECTPNTLTVKTYDDEEITFSFTETGISSSGANLISQGFTVSNQEFDCEETEYGPTVISIAFTLEKNLTSVRGEEKVTIPFKTTLSLRNY